jgi:hypothetical protein
MRENLRMIKCKNINLNKKKYWFLFIFNNQYKMFSLFILLNL